MNNFGVVELASARTTSAPGWAYVPDVSAHPSGAGLQPANRKRARNAPAGQSLGDLTARHEARVRKEIEALDRDGGGSGKDGAIPIPTRVGGRAQGKHTPNVRKILQSQKTFANHLDDFLALQAQSEGTAGPSSKRPVPANRGQDDNAIPDAMKIKPPTNKKNVIVRPSDILTPFRHPFASNGGSGSENSAAQDDGGKATNNSSHDDSSRSSDNNPLLASRVPPLPTDDELRALLEHPPLSYGEARGTWDDEARRRYPGRVFCEVCGYWGRVRCTKCGTRVCALQCLETHRAECVTRYGL